MMSDTQVTVVGGIALLIALVLAALFGVLLWYVLRALRKYLRSAQEREKAPPSSGPWGRSSGPTGPGAR